MAQSNITQAITGTLIGVNALLAPLGVSGTITLDTLYLQNSGSSLARFKLVSNTTDLTDLILIPATGSFFGQDLNIKTAKGATLNINVSGSTSMTGYLQATRIFDNL